LLRSSPSLMAAKATVGRVTDVMGFHTPVGPLGA
jgi:hypothetical protein